MARRKRNDPGDAPVDGDLRRDQVLNRQKGFRYYYLNEEDAVTWGQWGAVKETRGENSARPAFADASSESTPGYTIGGGALTLYKIPEAKARAREKLATDEDARRMATIRKETRARGGEFSVTTA